MDLKKALNLNTYKWWRNHRRVVTFGGFLVLFAWYLSPVIQEAKNKQSCIDIMRKEYVAGRKNKEIGYGTGMKYLNEKEEAFMAAYIKCNKLD